MVQSSVISVLGRWNQKDFEFKPSLGYIIKPNRGIFTYQFTGDSLDVCGQSFLLFFAWRTLIQGPREMDAQWISQSWQFLFLVEGWFRPSL
jgi:hypothetical protein